MGQHPEYVKSVGRSDAPPPWATSSGGRIEKAEMNVGIVGAEAAKFTVAGELEARRLIGKLLFDQDAVLVSGGCHLGGVDIWAEEAAGALGRSKIIHHPAELNWSRGFGPRNLLIARNSDVVHVIAVARFPTTFTGPRFPLCYHCARRSRERPYEPQTPSHVKSGGCWTAIETERLGKPAHWYVVQNEED